MDWWINGLLGKPARKARGSVGMREASWTAVAMTPLWDDPHLQKREQRLNTNSHQKRRRASRAAALQDACVFHPGFNAVTTAP